MSALTEQAGRHRGVVVGVDGSAHTKAAISWAARDAALHGLPLTLVHVIQPPMVLSWPENTAAEYGPWQSQGKEVIESATAIAEQAVAELGEVEIVSETFTEAMRPTLIELTKTAKLMVVASRGLGAFGRMLLGSVSSALVHHAYCPVAVIHDDADMADRLDAPVVVGVDGSTASETATALAFDEAARRKVELVAAHAWSDTIAIETPGITYQTMQGLGEEVLAERLAGWQERYPDVNVRRVVACDRPAHQLLELSEEAQLVVVGSHGRGGFAGMLLGSVSTKVVNEAHIPVIVARPD